MNQLAITPIVAEHVNAVNAQDEDAIVATFAPDALVNDAQSSGEATPSADGSPKRWSATRSPSRSQRR